jgi:hypothetical protein
VGKVLAAEHTSVYYLSQNLASVVKVNSRNYGAVLLPIQSASAFQLSVNSQRIYVVSEEGWLEVIYLKKEGLERKKGKAKEESDEESDEEGVDSQPDTVASDYEHKRVRIEPHVEDSDALNSSMMEKSIGEDAVPEQDELSVPKESSVATPMMFYRTLETNDKYTAVVSHNGRGINTIHLYDQALHLITTKKVVIKKQDHSFSLSRRALL